MKERSRGPIPAIIQDQCHVRQVRGVATSILGGEDGDRRGRVYGMCASMASGLVLEEEQGLKRKKMQRKKEKKNIENDASFGLIHKTQKRKNRGAVGWW